MAQKFKLRQFQLVYMSFERLFSLQFRYYEPQLPWHWRVRILTQNFLSMPCNRFLEHLKRENSLSKLIYTSWNCPNLNFCAKSCQSRYLFWLVFKNLGNKLIKTNNVIGKIWCKNSNWGNSNLCIWALKDCILFKQLNGIPWVESDFSCIFFLDIKRKQSFKAHIH